MVPSLQNLPDVKDINVNMTGLTRDVSENFLEAHIEDEVHLPEITSPK